MGDDDEVVSAQAPGRSFASMADAAPPEDHAERSPPLSDADDADAAFDEVDLDAEVVRQTAVKVQDAPRARMGTSFPLPSLAARPALPYTPSSPPLSPAPLGRLGMSAHDASPPLTPRRPSASSSNHSSSAEAPEEAITPEIDDEGDGETRFASTSSFDFAAAAAAATAPDMQMVVSNDLEGTFESVSLSRNGTTAEGKRPESRPSLRSSGSATSQRSVEPVEEPVASTSAVPAPAPPKTSTANGHLVPKAPKGGATALQKVLSKTRQRDLPPKERKEDDKHLKEYSTMLVKSKENEKKKEAVRKAKRQSREVALSLHRPTWERDIVPNWKTVLSDANLRRMWWDGSMPARFRANLWSACIGNALAIGKSSYVRSLSLAQSHLASGRFPAHVVEQIESEMDDTLRRVKLFQRDGPMWEDLRNLLIAYSVFHSPTPRYPTGASWPAALLLISMPVPDAFVCLANLVEKSCLKAFYADKKDEMDAYYRIFGTLLADAMPPVYRNFQSHDVRPAVYLHPWLTTCFARFFPVDTATRLFDVFLLEGDSFLFRAALAILDALEARLFNPDPVELAAVFAGQERGARGVVARTNGWSDETQVEVEDVYVALTGGEDRIFALIKEQDWRQQTWTRLVERELPE